MKKIYVRKNSIVVHDTDKQTAKCMHKTKRTLLNLMQSEVDIVIKYLRK